MLYGLIGARLVSTLKTLFISFKKVKTMATNIQKPTEQNRNFIENSLSTPNREEYLTGEQADKNFSSFLENYSQEIDEAFSILEGKLEHR